VLGARPNQLDRQRPDLDVAAADLLDISSATGEVTLAGLRANVEVAIRYLESWLRGNGAVAIHNLMEDAATAEISRSQLWQWVRNGTVLSDGTTVTAELVRRVMDEEMDVLGADFQQAREIFERVALDDEYVDFLTVPAYEVIR
jgi:malate synthase